MKTVNVCHKSILMIIFVQIHTIILPVQEILIGCYKSVFASYIYIVKNIIIIDLLVLGMDFLSTQWSQYDAHILQRLLYKLVSLTPYIVQGTAPSGGRQLLMQNAPIQCRAGKVMDLFQQ